MMKNKNGFTLIEVLMVSAVIGIMLAIAMPMYRDYMVSSRLKGDAQNIYSLLQSAKMRAVRERSDVRVVFDLGVNPQRVRVLTNAGATVVMTIMLTGNNSYGHGNATTPEGSTFGDNVTFNVDMVTFNSLGTANAGYVYIQNTNNETYTIGVFSTGLVRIRHWTGASWE